MSLLAWVLVSVAVVGFAVVMLMTEVKTWALQFLGRATTICCSIIRKGQRIWKRAKDWLGRLLGEKEVDGGGSDGSPMSPEEYWELLKKLAEQGKIKESDIPAYLAGVKELDLGNIDI